MATVKTGLVENTPRPIPLSLVLDSLIHEPWTRQEHWMARASLFVEDYYFVFLIPALLYYPVIFGLRMWMNGRKEPFKLRPLLIVWNAIMTTFSTIGFLFTAHALADSFLHGSMGYSMYSGVCGEWCFQYSAAAKLVFIFNVSKIFEFMDTIFIVLRKQPLIFLHYYHHLVTMLFCWYANQHGILLANCGPFYFSLMNYGVHMTMYAHYALRAMGMRIPGFLSMAITIAQIVQMVGGMTVLYFMGVCPIVDQPLQYFGWALYFSFFLLFVWFFLNRYVFKAMTQQKPKGATGRRGESSTAAPSATSPSSKRKPAKVE